MNKMWIFAFGRSSSPTLILTKLFDNKEDSQIHIHLLKKNTHHLYLALLYVLLHLLFTCTHFNYLQKRRLSHDYAHLPLSH